MMLMIMLVVGLGGTMLLLFSAFQGPSASKAVKRRMELLKERHADGVLAANANAQIRKLMQARESRVESMASSLIPKPALLRKRLDQTGRQITLGKYAMVSVGLCLGLAFLMIAKGATSIRSIPFSTRTGPGNAAASTSRASTESTGSGKPAIALIAFGQTTMALMRAATIRRATA